MFRLEDLSGFQFLQFIEAQTHHFPLTGALSLPQLDWKFAVVNLGESVFAFNFKTIKNSGGLQSLDTETESPPVSLISTVRRVCVLASNPALEHFSSC